MGTIAGTALAMTVLTGSAGAAATAAPGAEPGPARHPADDVPAATVLPATPGVVGSLRPERLYDSRTVKAFAPGEQRSICDTSPAVPNDDAAALVLNLTVVFPTASGYLTAWPLGSDEPPPVSTVNFHAGSVTSNLALVPLGAVECVTVRNTSTGSAHVLVDLQGYLTKGPATTAGGTQLMDARRLVDTRTARVAVPARGTLELQVAGKGGIPSKGVGAAWLNLTVTGGAAHGWLTAYPSGTPRPTAASLNFGAGETRAGLTLAALGPNGRVSIHNGSSRPVHVIVDASAWLRGSDWSGTLAGMVPVVPTRVLDTRTTHDVPGQQAVTVAWPDDMAPAGSSAALLAVTAVDATSPGWLSVANTETGVNGSSSVNFVPGRATTNHVLARLDGFTTVHNGSSKPVHVVVDVVGWVNPERAVEGRVLDVDGVGIAGAEVGQTTALTPHLATTRPDGTYSAFLPGSQRVVTPCARAMLGTGLPDRAYVPGCHRTWASPVTLPLGLGERATGADVVLEPAGTISGVARDEAGVGLTGGYVNLRRASDGRRYTASVGSDGSWSLTVAAGAYYVALTQVVSPTPTSFGLSDEWYPDVQVSTSSPTVAIMADAGAEPVTVAAGTSTTLDLVAEARARLGVSVSSADPAKPLGSTWRATLRRANGTVFASVTPTSPWNPYVHPGSVKACASRSAGEAEYCWEGDVPVDDATPITVAPGRHRTGITISLP